MISSPKEQDVTSNSLIYSNNIGPNAAQDYSLINVNEETSMIQEGKEVKRQSNPNIQNLEDNSLIIAR